MPFLRFLLLLAAGFIGFSLPIRAQLTLRVTAVPATTPAGAVLYLAGSFNNWNPGAAAYRLTPGVGGTYMLTLPTTVRGAIQFKLTRGNWVAVECTATGGARPDRTYTVPATGAVTLDVQVAGWADQFTAPPPTHTTSVNVSILDSAFVLPQLGGRTRRIWLYLPPDYATSQKTYPVLYMHDGQNLFDAATSFSGEWGVDETLDRLHQAGDWGCIVVGIDNGGANRLNEYSPYPNAQYGGGQGDQYVDFLVNTLKPFIDQRYRTRPDRLHTGVMGSSMGGLISLYAGLKRPDIFGRAGVFSPSLWFNRRIYTFARAARPVRPDPRIFLLSGGRESAGQRADHLAMADTLARAGFSRGAGGEVDTLLKTDGQHAEWFWKREFGAAYQWLFRGTGPLGESAAASEASAGLVVYPNPGPGAGGQLQVELADTAGARRVQLRDATGRVVRTARWHRGHAALDVGALPVGVYQVTTQNRRGQLVRTWVKY